MQGASITKTKHREQHVQRPRGRKKPHPLEKTRGDWCIDPRIEGRDVKIPVWGRGERPDYVGDFRSD